MVKQLQTCSIKNSYVNQFKTTINAAQKNCKEFKVVIRADRKPNNAHQFENRDIVLQSHDNKLQRISEIHRAALQYPLMFCHGEDGYSISIRLCNPTTKLPLEKKVSAASFYAYRIMIRQDEVNHIVYFRSLFSQFLVDIYAKIETERLNFIRNHQKQLIAENYIHLKDAVGKNYVDATDLGQMVVLPSSVTGGPRYMHERTQDAMTYVRVHGHPDLFITFTCNPTWKDIIDALFSGQKPHDRHDIIARVFHIKVKKLMALLTKGKLFGDVRCYIYSVEWQKRGLPHFHILLWLQNRISSNIIDNVISAEIPDPERDHLLYDIVKSNMIHGPCGSLNPNALCMKKNTCSKRYPRKLCRETQTGDDGYPEYKRKSTNDGGFTVRIKGLDLDNHWGSDQAAFTIENQKDEIRMYSSGRYISSAEAVRRILSFSIHERYPTVFHLAVHLGNGQRVYFTPNNLAENLNNPSKTTLLAFFELCKTDVFAKTIFYSEVPSYFVFKNNKFQKRKQGRNLDGWPTVKKDDALGRVYTSIPTILNLRMLLHKIRGPTSFSDLKTVNGILYNTFQSACNVLRLLEDDNHWNNTLNEASLSDSPSKLRELFTVMLVFCQLSDPLTLWDTHKNNISEDIIRQMDADQKDEAHNKCLIQIEDAVLAVRGQSISNYGLPQPTRTGNNFENIVYQREINYDLDTLTKVVMSNEALLTNEQYNVYSRIMHIIKSDTGKFFFLNAPAGTGKTFLINLLLTKVRSNRSIALAVASSGIAAMLLEGGGQPTQHSNFLSISLTSKRQCLIVWDESTMVHKRGFEALDRSFKDIRNKNEVMGGATVLLNGDFRQTLPLIPRGSPADEVKACIKALIYGR
ncbi:uncharacterized protein LOC126549818 [Aphis gossypii]|uniref:uncharacterized protein LOC126549818 n=1 Tax=Aphis gossypii TaxID=80765 RepID=UPI0021597040|nr:uncharacterized protein LOC126549818 [Aphis gossypii]